MRKTMLSLLISLTLLALYSTTALSADIGSRVTRKGGESLAAGSAHTVALKEDGSLWAWGMNNYGQLGIGTTEDQSLPVRVGSENHWISVSAGAEETFALKADGTLWAWGHNDKGQLGDGTTDTRSEPVQITTATNWTARISSGAYHTVALRADGSLWSWGNNDWGQLGTGGNVSSPVPVQIGSDHDWVEVSAGQQSTFALKANGTLWAWGRNDFGQLGLGTTTNETTPHQIGSDTKWLMVSAGGAHTLALKANGTIWSWGWNYYGQVGNGTTLDQHSPVQVGSLVGWRAIRARGGHSLAIMHDGSLYAWGLNDHGQLGDGSTVNKSSPVKLSGSGYVDLMSGSSHSMVRKANGTLWVWGRNNFGQLGNGPSGVGTDINQPMLVLTGVGADTKITTGWDQLLYYLLKPDGTLWRNNGFHEGSVLYRASDDTDWLTLNSMHNTQVMVKADGTLWGWGYNECGRIGIGSYSFLSNPVQIGSDSDWVATAVGVAHILALKSDGSLWARGCNNYGQLGDRTTVSKSQFVRVGIDNDWASIACSDEFSAAIKSDGSLWAWGRNSAGNLGDGTLSQRIVPVRVGSDNNWVTAVGKRLRTMALKADGTLWGWGENYHGQLGIGSFGVNVPLPQIVINSGFGNNWKWISVGDYYTGSIKADGSLWMWGDNSNMQLGMGYGLDKWWPMPVPLGRRAIGLVTGFTNSFALTSDRAIFILNDSPRYYLSTLFNTSKGNNSISTPVDFTTGDNSVTLQFNSVLYSGTTSVTTSTNTVVPPDGFMLGNPPITYDISTTATFSGSVRICINYSGSTFNNESALKLMHYQSGAWVNITLPGYPDTTNDIICGVTSSFSEFTVLEGASNASPVIPAGAGIGQCGPDDFVSPTLGSTTTGFQVQDLSTFMGGLIGKVYIDWGDGSPMEIMPAGAGSGPHTYANPGTYKIRKTTQDDDFGFNCWKEAEVTVSDMASGGFGAVNITANACSGGALANVNVYLTNGHLSFHGATDTSGLLTLPLVTSTMPIGSYSLSVYAPQGMTCHPTSTCDTALLSTVDVPGTLAVYCQ